VARENESRWWHSVAIISFDNEAVGGVGIPRATTCITGATTLLLASDAGREERLSLRVRLASGSKRGRTCGTSNELGGKSIEEFGILRESEEAATKPQEAEMTRATALGTE